MNSQPCECGGKAYFKCRSNKHLLTVSNDTIRCVSEEEGKAAGRWIQKSPVPGETFRRASGDQEWVLDVFHVSQHIHDCGKALFGEKSPQARPWSQAQLQSLIEEGPVSYLKNLRALQAIHDDSEKIKAIRSLVGYLEPNLDSLWYRQRLADGRPIGTGLIEGGCKTIVSNRLKLNSARWTPQACRTDGGITVPGLQRPLVRILVRQCRLSAKNISYTPSSILHQILNARYSRKRGSNDTTLFRDSARFASRILWRSASVPIAAG